MLQQLKRADGALWSSQKSCLPGTRSELLSQLEEFASTHDPSSAARVLLLTGVAGCGKTAIAQSVAQRFNQKAWPQTRLGACFHFSAQVEDRRTTRLFYSTLAFALSGLDPSIEERIIHALSSDRNLPSASPVKQFDDLILLPLSSFSQSHPVVLIIDALDEIADKHDLDSLLDMLVNNFRRLPPTCRVIITSRPNPNIIRRLESSSHIEIREIAHRDASSVRDIRLVATATLSSIAKQRDLGLSWPGADLEERLIKKVGGLFIWLDVACTAVLDSREPTRELKRLLAGNEIEPDMDALYSIILSAYPWRKRTISSNYRLVLGTIIALKTPLSAEAIEHLLGDVLEVPVLDVLEPLASVIVGVSTPTRNSSPNRPLEILHETFREFVVNRDMTDVPEGERKYTVDEVEASRRLGLRCLLVMNDELPRHAKMLQRLFPDNESDGRDIPSPQDGVVSGALGYACDYWMAHLSAVTEPDANFANVLRLFLRTNLISWMQLCASRGRFSGIDRLQEWLNRVRCILLRVLGLQPFAHWVRSPTQPSISPSHLNRIPAMSLDVYHAWMLT